MATLTASNDTTGKSGHRHTFRVCYNAWMGAKALGKYLTKNMPDKTYFYITADYTLGWSTETSLRHFTHSVDKERHRNALVPFPSAKEADFFRALFAASAAKPDLLVLILFGKDMERAVKMVVEMGFKDKFKLDFFEILDSFPGAEVVHTEQEWQAERQAAGLPPALEPLPAKN